LNHSESEINQYGERNTSIAGVGIDVMMMPVRD